MLLQDSTYALNRPLSGRDLGLT